MLLDSFRETDTLVSLCLTIPACAKSRKSKPGCRATLLEENLWFLSKAFLKFDFKFHFLSSIVPEVSPSQGRPISAQGLILPLCRPRHCCSQRPSHHNTPHWPVFCSRAPFAHKPAAQQRWHSTDTTMAAPKVAQTISWSFSLTQTYPNPASCPRRPGSRLFLRSSCSENIKQQHGQSSSDRVFQKRNKGKSPTAWQSNYSIFSTLSHSTERSVSCCLHRYIWCVDTARSSKSFSWSIFSLRSCNDDLRTTLSWRGRKRIFFFLSELYLR